MPAMNTTTGAIDDVGQADAGSGPPRHALELERTLKILCGDVAEVEVLESVGSSNQYLLDGPLHDPQRPRLVWTLAQPQGRGRRGRAWVGVPRHSLMISMSFVRAVGDGSQPPLSGLPIAIGLTLARTLSEWAPDLRLKWPNDLQRAGQKCAGLLLEARSRQPLATPDGVQRPSGRYEQVVAGFGLNLYWNAESNGTVGQPVCGLFDHESYAPRATIAARLARQLVQAWQQFQSQGLNGVIAQWPRWDALADQPVVVLDGERILQQGVARGIAASGALLIETATGISEVSFGDVSVRARRP